MNVYTKSSPVTGVNIIVSLNKCELPPEHNKEEDCVVHVKTVPLVFSCGNPNHTRFDPTRQRNTRKPANKYSARFFFNSISAGNIDDVHQCMDYVDFKRVVDDEDRNALLLALFLESEGKRKKLLKLFADGGVSSTHVDRTFLRDALGWSCFLGLAWEARLVINLRDDGDIDYHKQDVTGNTYLHLAVMSTDAETVALIFNLMREVNLDVDKTNSEGLTAYILARRLGLREIANNMSTEGGASAQRSDDCMFLTARQWSILGFEERHNNWVKSHPIKPRLPDDWPQQVPPASATSSLPVATAANGKDRRKKSEGKTAATNHLSVVHSFMNTWSDQRGARKQRVPSSVDSVSF